MMYCMILIVLCHVALLGSIVYMNLPQTCHVLEPEFRFHLATKTPYRVVANFNDSVVSYAGCTARKILGVIRHGTRTPGTDRTEAVKLRLPAIIQDLKNHNAFTKSKLCPDEIQKLENWNLLIGENDDKILTHEGEEEMINLAERIRNRFPDLLSQKYSNDTYYLRFTATQRAHESAKYFAIGLFGRQALRQVWFPEALDKDPILRFYKLCEKWRAEVKKNPAAIYEYTEFKKTDEMNNLRARVSERLGLPYVLSEEDIQLMYMTCSFEAAMFKNIPSAWCTPFTMEDLKVIEFSEDIKYYWRDGYGYELNYLQACTLVNHVLESLEDESRKAVFYFTHSGTMLKLLARLGLYSDEFQLTADLDAARRNSRNWRTSYIDAFGTNLQFVLFDCESGGPSVVVFHQERPVIIPGCDSELCPLTTLQQIFNATTDQCQFSAMCALNSE